MNRAERRRLKRAEEKQPRTSVEYEQGFHDGMAHANEILFYLTAYTISYKLGFGRERLQKIMMAIYNNVDGFRTGHLEPQDFDTIREEMRLKYGIKLN